MALEHRYLVTCDHCGAAAPALPIRDGVQAIRGYLSPSEARRAANTRVRRVRFAVLSSGARTSGRWADLCDTHRTDEIIAGLGAAYIARLSRNGSARPWSVLTAAGAIASGGAA